MLKGRQTRNPVASKLEPGISNAPRPAYPKTILMMLDECDSIENTVT